MEDTTDQFVVFPVTLRRVRNAILFRGVFDCVKSFAQLSLKSNFKSDRLYTVASSWPSAAPRDDIVNESKELWLSSCGNSHSRISYTGITELLLKSQTWISQTNLMPYHLQLIRTDFLYERILTANHYFLITTYKHILLPKTFEPKHIFDKKICKHFKKKQTIFKFILRICLCTDN